MMTTPRPCSASPDTSASTCSVCALERRGRLVEDDEPEPFHQYRPRDGYRLAPPPESVAPRRIEPIVVTRRVASVSRVFLHRRLLKEVETRWSLSPEVHVLDHVEVVGESEVLVHDLNPESPGVRLTGPEGIAAEEHLAAVRRLGARDALDERRLARSVVTDERHDLAHADSSKSTPASACTEPNDWYTREAREGGLCIAHGRGVLPHEAENGSAPKGRLVRQSTTI